jgi:hypothetical protein
MRGRQTVSRIKYSDLLKPKPNTDDRKHDADQKPRLAGEAMLP